ncbi:MAG TPA: hypothetical protein VJ085_02635 [Candidatus Acidoferrales bacterium]|nr:hypothetical protein [Candidatus Acidoferrales bacterium]
MTCRVRGCENPVLGELEESALCLDHFLEDITERVRGFDRGLEDPSADESLRETALRFSMLTAAKIATIGIHHPPEEQLARGQLLNAMLLLADLRDRLDRTTAQ